MKVRRCVLTTLRRELLVVGRQHGGGSNGKHLMASPIFLVHISVVLGHEIMIVGVECPWKHCTVATMINNNHIAHKVNAIIMVQCSLCVPSMWNRRLV